MIYNNNPKSITMKSLKVTLMLAVFCLTISGTSNTSETKLTINKEQIEAYKEINKNRDFIAEVGKTTKKPGHQL